MNGSIQITPIKNGYLVATQPSGMMVQQAISQGQTPQPVVTFCENFMAVVATLKGEFPANDTKFKVVEE